ncbi:restriction endonuclease subunit S [Tautonia rosea]|uniref:restriction endonuclease subunit S n=1 Tax=Tautonia rosea TaxID=2728037 RepID=UPI00147478CB
MPVRGGSPRPAGDPRFFDGSYIPWLTVAALTNIPESRMMVSETASCLTEEGALRSRTLLPGTLIIANSGATLGVAKILGIKCCANDGIAAILNLKKGVSAAYLAHYINTRTNYLRDVVATGNGQPNLNTELIGNFKIPLPPTLSEQEAIAEALSDADASIESLEQLIAKKRQLKQGTMQELLTGKRRLPGFSGDWETKRFDELFSVIRNASNSRSELTEEGDVAYVHYGDIHTHQSAFLDVKSKQTYISRDHVLSVPRLANGDLLMADASEDTEAIGKAVEIVGLNGTEAVGGLHTMVLRPKGNALVDGFKGYIQFIPMVRSALVRLATGVSVYGVTKSGVRAIEVKIPDPDEQAAISTILREMDEGIDCLEDKLAKARCLKHGMMQELLTGRVRLV